MEHQIVSGIDNKTVIGKCRFDKRTGEFCDIRTVDGDKEYEPIGLYDNGEVYRANDCLNLEHAHGVYQIALERLDTPKKAYQWLVHLLEKNWITRDMLARMVRILEIYFGYNLHEFSDAAQ